MRITSSIEYATRLMTTLARAHGSAVSGAEPCARANVVISRVAYSIELVILIGIASQYSPSCSFASSVAIVRGSHDGVNTRSTSTSFTPGMRAIAEWVEASSIGPYGHAGEVRLMRTLTDRPFSLWPISAP